MLGLRPWFALLRRALIFFFTVRLDTAPTVPAGGSVVRMERLGIVGLPNAGKSSLFNALTGGSAVVAPHPFSTTETNVGVAHVPDHRLTRARRDVARAARWWPPRSSSSTSPASSPGRRPGEGLGNRFLAGIREADAVCLVLRSFEDANVPGGTDPLDDLGVLELELVLADAATVETQADKRRKAAKGGDRHRPSTRSDALDAALKVLQGGTPIWRSSLDGRAARRRCGRSSSSPTRACSRWSTWATTSSPTPTPSSSRCPSELGGAARPRCVRPARGRDGAADPTPSAAELLEGLGLGEGALPRVAQAAYDALGRRTFLTTGDKESRAWTFRAGAKAPECAGVIHSDLQRGFIRAEVIRWDELLTLGSWHAAKEAGKLRVEGKDYEVVDGDVLEIRFNV